MWLTLRQGHQDGALVAMESSLTGTSAIGWTGQIWRWAWDLHGVCLQRHVLLFTAVLQAALAGGSSMPASHISPMHSYRHRLQHVT